MVVVSEVNDPGERYCWLFEAGQAVEARRPSRNPRSVHVTFESKTGAQSKQAVFFENFGRGDRRGDAVSDWLVAVTS
jgi:hypothetical protein